MIMNQQAVETVESRLATWADEIAGITLQSKNVTLGLISGNRSNNDARVVFQLVRQLQHSLDAKCADASMLLCRLDVRSPSSMSLLTKEADDLPEPKIEKSALGNWGVVEVPMTVGNVAPRALQMVPRLLPKWKLRYNLVVIDLGPLHVVPSRIVGRLCDCNFVVLGPGSCASAQWITQYITYHEDCGSHIGGTICATAAA